MREKNLGFIYTNRPAMGKHSCTIILLYAYVLYNFGNNKTKGSKEDRVRDRVRVSVRVRVRFYDF
jgi:hypothetical protein